MACAQLLIETIAQNLPAFSHSPPFGIPFHPVSFRTLSPAPRPCSGRSAGDLSPPPLSPAARLLGLDGRAPVALAGLHVDAHFWCKPTQRRALRLVLVTDFKVAIRVGIIFPIASLFCWSCGLEVAELSSSVVVKVEALTVAITMGFAYGHVIVRSDVQFEHSLDAELAW